ncbi:hypothetical protein HNP84_003232 [Thermocatellispora tengchongensis]|uniref:Uncharacterized protein n=1 Tax=Thermocatellispora tengchongensis TaxID=1073253 RepID=A0A840P4R8_9ACTN|nr:hypothetical protein [Thermocatellispora tengchongensis]MBB5133506.1 hypothetical protein [Thermocatellispora tengchongensis]
MRKKLARIGAAAFGGVALCAVAFAGAGAAQAAAPGAVEAGHAVVRADPVRWDFRVPGVRIFLRAHAGSPVLGLGYPGQGFETERFDWGPEYVCDNGSIATLWGYGRNLATGVRGFVPSCNLV